MVHEICIKTYQKWGQSISHVVQVPRCVADYVGLELKRATKKTHRMTYLKSRPDTLP